MGHHTLRNDNECQNCGYTVDVAYCSKCGQQNTDTRQSFHHLLTHFAEDLTHYDGAFWKTIKYLLFRPGRLTIEYLQGHRMRYVPTVKLYIFISFVTFFLMAIMAPDTIEESHDANNDPNANVVTTVSSDGIHFSRQKKDVKKIKYYNGVNYKTLKQFDSIHNVTPEYNKLPYIDYHFERAVLIYKEHNPSLRDIIILVSHTIPKILFIYMPIFAFWLWLLHGKKRWYFFDHGIFTLHYFSLLLLLVTIMFLIDWGIGYIPYDQITNTIIGFILCVFSIYPIFYFFRSHSRFYGERKAISRLKSILLFFINFVCFMIITAVTFVYIAYNLH